MSFGPSKQTEKKMMYTQSTAHGILLSAGVMQSGRKPDSTQSGSRYVLPVKRPSFLAIFELGRSRSVGSFA